MIAIKQREPKCPECGSEVCRTKLVTDIWDSSLREWKKDMVEDKTYECVACLWNSIHKSDFDWRLE